MKKAILISMVFSLLLSFDVSAGIKNDKLFVKSIKQLLFSHGNLNFQNPADESIFEVFTFKEVSFINTTQIFLTFVILIFAFFIIICIPLILFYFWISNYLDYQKNHTIIHALKANSQKISAHHLSAYKRIFSNMYANGFGIITWILSSYYFVYMSYSQVSDGLLNYLNFPFKVLSGVMNEAVTFKDAIPLNVWVNMLLIMGVSILTFFLGRIIGETIISKNYKKSLFPIKKPQVVIST